MRSNSFNSMIIVFLLLFNNVTATPLESLVSNHMLLARLVHSIILPEEVANLTAIEVLARFWSLPDAKQLEDVLALNDGAPFAPVQDILNALDAVPDGILLPNVTEVSQIIQDLNSTSPAKMMVLKTTSTTKLPSVLESSWHFDKFQKNYFQLALNSIHAFVTKPSKDKQSAVQKSFGDCLIYYDPATFANWKAFIDAKPSEKYFNEVPNGVDIANGIGRFDNQGNVFKTLDNNLEAALDAIGKLAPFEAIISNNLTHPIATLNSLIANSLIPPARLPIGRSNENLSLESSKWLKTILNFDNADGLTKMLSDVSASSSLLQSFSGLRIMSSTRIHRQTTKVNELSTLASDLVALKTSTTSKFPPLRALLASLSNRPSGSSVDSISQDLRTIEVKVSAILMQVKNIQDEGTTILNHAIGQLKTHTSCSKACIQTLNATATFLNSVEPYSRKLSSEVDSAFLALTGGMLSKGATVKATLSWLSAVHSFVETELPTVDVDPFKKLLGISKEIKLEKGRKSLAVFRNETEQWISSTAKGLNTLQTNLGAIRGKKLGKIDKLSKHREIFLEVIEGISSLERIVNLNANIRQVIEGRTTVIQKAIDEDAVVKAAIGSVWDNFTQVQGALEKEIVDKVNVLEALAFRKTANISDMLPIYQKVVELNISNPSVDLNPFIQSLDTLPSPSPDILEYSKVLDEVDRCLKTTNWDLQFASFQKTSDALLDVDAIFYNHLRGKRTRKTINKVQVHSSVSFVPLIVYIAASLIVFLISLALAGWKRFGKKRKKVPMHLRPKSPPDPTIPPYTCTNQLYSHVQLQDARLKINKRDKFNRTALFRAVENSDIEEAKRLLEAGALVDAVCGFKLFSPLLLAVVNWNRQMVELLLQHGAWIYQPNVFGDNPNSFEKCFGFKDLFEEHNVKRPLKRTLPPNQPRSFHILVVDRKSFGWIHRRKLAPNIRAKIVFGYRRKMRLNQFTHIVLPDRYVGEDGQTLLLNNTEPFIWKCVAALGNLMSTKWLKAMKSNPDALHNDIPYMLIHTQFNNKPSSEALLCLKTDMHRGRPKFLKNVCIKLLSTKNTLQMAKQGAWAETFAMFAAQMVERPVECSFDTLEPYSAQYQNYFEFNDWISSVWIVKYEDSEVDPKYLADWEKFTVVRLDFVLQCIAQFRILPTSNTDCPIESRRPIHGRARCADYEHLLRLSEQEDVDYLAEKIFEFCRNNPTESYKKLVKQCEKLQEARRREEEKLDKEAARRIEKEMDSFRKKIRADLTTEDSEMASVARTVEEVETTQETPVSQSKEGASRKRTKSLDTVEKTQDSSMGPAVSNKKASTKKTSTKKTSVKKTSMKKTSAKRIERTEMSAKTTQEATELTQHK